MLLPGHQVGQYPGRDVLEGVRGVLDGRAVDRDPEPGREVGEVVAVLRLLGLGKDDQPAAGAHEALDGVELVVGQARGPDAGRVLPGVVGRMRKDDDVDVREGGVVEWAVGVDVDSQS